MWTWWWAVLAAGVLTAAHFVSRRRSPPAPLPTARFVPGGARPRHTRRLAFEEQGTWILRLLVLACLAAALSPRQAALPRSGRTRVVLVDATRAVASATERADSVAALARDGARLELVAFDSAARDIPATDVAALASADVAGALDAALVEAVRRVQRARAEVRAVELAVVSPVVAEEWSEAVPAIVGAAGVPVRFVRLGAARRSDTTRAAAALPSADSPLGAAAQLAAVPHEGNVRLVTAPAGASDSAFALQGGALVIFEAPVDSAPVRALLAGNAVAIGAWGAVSVTEGAPVAWWEDGSVAARQRGYGAGCVRHVGARLPARGDDVLRPSLARVVRVLSQPCATRDFTPVPDAWLAALGATDGDRGTLAPSLTTRRAWLLAALVALLAEWGWRRRRERGAS